MSDAYGRAGVDLDAAGRAVGLIRDLAREATRQEELDLAGFCVGVVDERSMLGPHRVREGDALIGLASTGLHANGYSLVRKALLEDGGHRLDDVLPPVGPSLGNELLE